MIRFHKAKTSWYLGIGHTAFYFWFPGTSISFLWNKEYHRLSFGITTEHDDGCYRIRPEFVYWIGKTRTNSYKKDSKRYIKMNLNIRYRARKKPWVSTNPRVYENKE
jgi:hypothetical protein